MDDKTLLEIARKKRNKWVCANCGRIHTDNIFYCQCGDTEKIPYATELDKEKEYLCLENELRYLYARGSWRVYTLDCDLVDHGLSDKEVLRHGVIEFNQYYKAQQLLGKVTMLYGDFSQLSLFEG